MKKLSLNIAIVDDIQTEIDFIQTVLGDYAATNQIELIMHCFHSAEELLAGYHPFAYTVIFMDIYMNGMTGMDATEKLRAVDSDVLIVFLTTSEEHMPYAFRFHAYDYIRKPADRERLFALMDDILKCRTVVSNSPKLTFSSNRMSYSIPYPDIVYVRTEANYLWIMDKCGNTYKTRMTFSYIRERLDGDNHFLQLLRGILVNMDYIENFDDGICHLVGGIRLPINVRNAKKIEQTWQNYVFSRIRSKQKDLLNGNNTR